jgi:peptidyl-prolyl cis-trans isomerase SurA
MGNIQVKSRFKLEGERLQHRSITRRKLSPRFRGGSKPFYSAVGWAGLILCTGMLTAGCKHSYGPDVVATVNGHPIMRADLEKYYRDNLGQSNQQPSQEQAQATKLQILQELIRNEILQQRATKLHTVATDEAVDSRLAEYKAPYTEEQFNQRLKAANLTIQDLRDQIRRALTQEELINKEITSRIDVTDADITNFYNSNKARFDFIEPMYHIAEIEVSTQPPQMQQGANLQNSKAGSDAEARKKIQMLHSRLESGEDFGAIAANFSDNTNDASNGGDMGLISESSLHQDPTVFAAISKLKPGEMTDIVPLTQPGEKTPTAYAIYKLLEIEPAGQRELNDPRVQQDIRQQLQDSRKQLLQAAYFEMLHDQAHIENYLAEQIFKNGAQ